MSQHETAPSGATRIARPPAGEPDVALLRRKLSLLEREMGPYEPDAACCGATVAQCSALLEIASLGTVSLGGLAAATGLDESTLSRTVEALVRKRLASREPVPGDRRSVAIALTPQGRRAAAALDRAIDVRYREILERIPEDRRSQVIESIALFADAVAGHNRAAGPKSR